MSAGCTGGQPSTLIRLRVPVVPAGQKPQPIQPQPTREVPLGTPFPALPGLGQVPVSRVDLPVDLPLAGVTAALPGLLPALPPDSGRRAGRPRRAAVPAERRAREARPAAHPRQRPPGPGGDRALAGHGHAALLRPRRSRAARPGRPAAPGALHPPSGRELAGRREHRLRPRALHPARDHAPRVDEQHAAPRGDAGAPLPRGGLRDRERPPLRRWRGHVHGRLRHARR